VTHVTNKCRISIQEKRLDGRLFPTSCVPLSEPALAAGSLFFQLCAGSPIFVFSASGLFGLDGLDDLPGSHQSLLGGPHLFVHVGMTRCLMLSLVIDSVFVDHRLPCPLTVVPVEDPNVCESLRIERVRHGLCLSMTVILSVT
jgi:hypothetical protein